MPRAKRAIIVAGVYNRDGSMRVDITPPGGNRRQITVGPWSQKEAVAWSARRTLILQEIEHGVFRWQDHFTPKQWGEASSGVQDGSTFGDCADMLVEELASGKPQTREVMRTRLKKWESLWPRKVSMLKPNDLKVASQRSGLDKLAPNSQRAYISACRSVIALAKENGLFDENLQAFHALDDKLTSITPKRGRTPKRPFHPSDMDRLLGVIRDNYLSVFRDWYEFQFFSGLRPSETRALQWGDVDFDKGLIQVRRAKHAHYPVAAPKTRAGIRTVRMLPRARDALLRRFEAVGGALSPSRLVFENPATGGFMDYHHNASSGNSTAVVWREALELAGLEHRAQYTARHTFASNLYNAGVDPRIAANQMGHANTDVFHEVYAEFEERETDWAQLDAAAQKIEAAAAAPKRTDNVPPAPQSQ